MSAGGVLMRAMVVCASLLLLCCAWLLLCPSLPSYHPFHPNHAHLPSAYLPHSAFPSSLTRWSPSYLLSTLLEPSSYIEGWYLKLHTADDRHFALIFFYFQSHTQPERSVSGVMLLDGQRELSHLYVFPLAAFASSPLPSAASTLSHLLAEGSSSSSSPFRTFTLRLDGSNNSLSPSHISAQLQPPRSAAPEAEWYSSTSYDASAAPSVRLSAELTPSAAAAAAASSWRAAAGWTQPSFFSPVSHTVGLFAFLPLACYQQMIELDLDVQGSLTLDDTPVDLRGAKAYLEKTRGFSFPDHYVWMHADAFTSLGSSSTTSATAASHPASSARSLLSSFFFSIASVPILPTSLHLPGFVCSFLFNRSVLTLSTQEGSILTHLAVTDERVSVVVWERGWRRRLSIDVQRVQGRRGVSTRDGREVERGEPAQAAEEVEGEGFLWAARGGALKRVIHQQLGLDRVTVTWAEATQGEQLSEQESGGVGGAEEEGEGSGAAGGAVRGVGVEWEASEWRRRGWSLRPLLTARSRSMGLEVFTRNAAAFERQVRDMYAQVRPWTRSAWLDVHTPVVSFPLSQQLVLTCMPAPLASALRRHAGLLRHAPALVVAALACLALPLLLRRFTRRLDPAPATRGVGS